MGAGGKVMRIGDDYTSVDVELESPAQRFRGQADLDEGVSGRARIDTSYENDQESRHPRQMTPNNGAWKDDFEDLGVAEDVYLDYPN